MIENHRTGLLWDRFMSCPELAPMMKAIGWRREHEHGSPAKTLGIKAIDLGKAGCTDG